jgi:nitrogen regulatory protein P-II 1
MIKIEAIIREEKMQEVLDALTAIEVNGLTISQVSGHGTQKGYKEFVRATEVEVNLIPKIKFDIVVSSEEWEEKTIKAIIDSAYTGEPGDGKIFSYDLRNAIRIRTGEKGYDALN